MEFTDEPCDISYFKQNDLLKYFSKNELENIENKYIYIDPFFGVKDGNKIPYPIDVQDLTNLHKNILERKVFTVLEFGVGYSTIIMADALLKHKKLYNNIEKKPHIRCSNMFEIHCVDSNEYWIKELKKKIENFPSIAGMINIIYSPVSIGKYNDRICHYYNKLPNIVPHLIYLDAPGSHDVGGEIKNINFNKNCDRTVMSGDLLFLEPTFLPGMKIIVDGRTNNAQFLKNNFQRNYIENCKDDITTFELLEKPLGEYNKNMLDYCCIAYK